MKWGGWAVSLFRSLSCAHKIDVGYVMAYAEQVWLPYWAKLAPNYFFFSNIHQCFVSQSWSLEQEKASSDPIKVYYLVIFFSVWNQIHSSVSDLCFELLLWGRTHCSATLSKHGLVRETVEWGIHHKLWKNTQTAFLKQIKQPSNLDSSVQHHRSQRKMWSST